MSEEKYKGRKYTVQDYNPNWVNLYIIEADSLHKVIGDQIFSIEHIGSTSVPGLAGKPTIDILVTTKEIGTADEFADKLASLGYTSLGEYVMEGSRLYTKDKTDERLVNLHFFKQSHKHVAEMLDLRNYLRSHPEVVKEYSQIKFNLFHKYPNDYGSYRKFKDGWMNELKGKI